MTPSPSSSATPRRSAQPCRERTVTVALGDRQLRRPRRRRGNRPAARPAPATGQADRCRDPGGDPVRRLRQARCSASARSCASTSAPVRRASRWSPSSTSPERSPGRPDSRRRRRRRRRGHGHRRRRVRRRRVAPRHRRGPRRHVAAGDGRRRHRRQDRRSTCPRARTSSARSGNPSGVICDTDALATLPPRERRSGDGEMAKYHFLTGDDLDGAAARRAGRPLRRDQGRVRRRRRTRGRPTGPAQLRAHARPRLGDRHGPRRSPTARPWASASSTPPSWQPHSGASTRTESPSTAPSSAERTTCRRRSRRGSTPSSCSR